MTPEEGVRILLIGIIFVIGLWLATLTYLVLAKRELKKVKKESSEGEESQDEGTSKEEISSDEEEETESASEDQISSEDEPSEAKEEKAEDGKEP